MRLRLTLLLYNLLLPLGMLVMLPASILKMRRRGGYGPAFWQRLGLFRTDVRERLRAGRGRAWWLHAVSVGEVSVAQKLITEILRREPDRPLVLSVTTSTGRAVAVHDAPHGLTVIYSPLDFPWIVRAVLKTIQPQKYILVEAEVWPNLVRRAQKSGIPVVLVNARLSLRSERRFRAWHWLAAPVFAMLDRVLVQDESDVARWAAIGVRPDCIQCTGSIKYDLADAAKTERVDEFRAMLYRLWGDPLPPLLLAASTHAGEEKALAEVFMELQREFPALVFLVAPRHFERRAEVQADIAPLGLRVAFRSALPDAPSQPNVLIVDSTGELRDWQALASVVVIGKSFLATGGQNPAEAIAAGVPVFTGPHMENFLPLMDLLLKAGGICQVPSLEALTTSMREAFANPEAARSIAAKGRQALDHHRGATVRTVDAITAV